jgi:3-hydroxyisobutyrate dehydrogenase
VATLANIAFIGLGAMGLQMANNLLALGHQVTGCDRRESPVARLAEQGGRAAENVRDAVRDADFVISMLPTFDEVRQLYLETPDLLTSLQRRAIVIDCSTIGIDEARTVAAGLESAGIAMLDAPVIGDPRDARVRLLTFAVGGSSVAFIEAKPILEDMGDRVIHCGKSGSGQAAVLCTHLMTAINTIAAAEAFALGEREGLAVEKLFEVSSMSTASSWALVERCPQAGLVPAAPSNQLYQAGLSAERVRDYLRLAEAAALKVDARVPMTSQAVDLFAEFCDTRDPRLDFSAIIQILRRR